MTVTLSRNLRRPEIGPGGDCLSRGFMPRLVPSFPSLIGVLVSKHSWQNNTPTHALPLPAHPLLSEAVLAFRRPATAANDASSIAWLTLDNETPMFSTLPPISYQTAR